LLLPKENTFHFRGRYVSNDGSSIYSRDFNLVLVYSHR